MITTTKFAEFIQSIPHGLYKVFRRRVNEALIKESLDVSDQTFRNWESGRCEPTDKRRELINSVALNVVGRKIYNEDK